MNKEELAEVLGQKLNLSKKAALQAVENLFEIIFETLKRGEEVNITGVGAFYAGKRASRQGVNPRTGEKITIPEMRLPKFRAGKRFKEALR